MFLLLIGYFTAAFPDQQNQKHVPSATPARQFANSIRHPGDEKSGNLPVENCRQVQLLRTDGSHTMLSMERFVKPLYPERCHNNGKMLFLYVVQELRRHQFFLNA